MMAHTESPERLAKQARIMADAGCQCVYVVDSAGALDPRAGRRTASAALVAELGDDAQVGFHGHENLGLGVANTILAIRAGAVQVDGSTRRFGAGAGNAPSEALVAVCDKLGIRTGIDVFKMFDAAEDVVRPVMDDECALDRLSLVMGYAGVYSSFLKHAYRVGGALRRVGRGDSSCGPASASSSAARRTSSSTSPSSSPRSTAAPPSLSPRRVRRSDRGRGAERLHQLDRAGRTSRRAGAGAAVAPASAVGADTVDDLVLRAEEAELSANASASASVIHWPHTSTRGRPVLGVHQIGIHLGHTARHDGFDARQRQQRGAARLRDRRTDRLQEPGVARDVVGDVRRTPTRRRRARRDRAPPAARRP